MEICTRQRVLNRRGLVSGLWNLAVLSIVAGLVGCGGGAAGDADGGSEDNSPYPTSQMAHIRPNESNVGIVRKVMADNVGSADTAGPAKVVSNDGWADVSGVIRIEGDPPADNLLDITKDQQVCSPGNKPVFGGSMVVGSDKGLGNVLIFVTSKVSPEWEHPEHKATATAELKGPQAFDQKNCVFAPHVYAMRSTQKLDVLNSDPIGHNTNISEFGYNMTIGAKDSTIFEPGREKRTPFQVRCSIHPWMKAWMITRDNPYFTISKPDGTFTIPKVPAGVELEFTVWHERSPSPKFDVNGTEESRKFVLTLKKDSPVELNLTVDASQFKG